MIPPGFPRNYKGNRLIYLYLGARPRTFPAVSRERDRLEREQRARCYYEQQLRERKKKILEQRLREETRRAAVEEKRNQRLKEEKVGSAERGNSWAAALEGGGASE